MPPSLSGVHAVLSSTLDRSPQVTNLSLMGYSMRSCVSVPAQEQLQLSEQQCDAMHAAHAAVVGQLRGLLEARRVLSTRLQVR